MILQIEYLISKNGFTKTCQELRVSKETLKSAIDNKCIGVSKNFISKIKKTYNSTKKDDRLYLLDKLIANDVINYDEDGSLTDLDIITSRHGSNRQSGSRGACHNNGNIY